MEHYKKVYVYSPPNFASGGPETLHTIVSVINDFGGDAYIYYGDGEYNIPSAYAKYNLRVADHVEDSNDNLLVVSEYCINILHGFKHIHKAILFLSVEYYLKNQIDYVTRAGLQRRHIPQIFYPLAWIFLKTTRPRFFKKVDFSDSNLILACNGEVNKRFLVEQKGVDVNRIHYVCGPLNAEFLNSPRVDLRDKENVVAYNPKKGWEFTEKIINKYSELYENCEFVPIQDMTAKQVHELLQRAKVYIDFGSHPGPERIPREAVVSYCNILTSKCGSAFYQEDVPIPENFKFDCADENIEKICALICDMLLDYTKYTSYFDLFREKVFNQPELFKQNVIKAFYYRAE